ncbi:MAG: hypothetical protein JWM16_5625 [Verrucomicrobiales bacterium]|nr:hypothetical protein [Verrucomicrobiales bacterium]
MAITVTAGRWGSTVKSDFGKRALGRDGTKICGTGLEGQAFSVRQESTFSAGEDYVWVNTDTLLHSRCTFGTEVALNFHRFALAKC